MCGAEAAPPRPAAGGGRAATLGYLELEAALGGCLHPGAEVSTAVVLAFLALVRGARVVELGCGAGSTAAALAATGATVVAADRSAAMLAAARRRAGRVAFVRLDLATGLPFAAASCDAVVAESVVALVDPAPLLAECLRVLRPGGRLALTERVWRPGTDDATADAINAASVAAFGVPAAAAQPRDRDAWLAALGAAGATGARAVAVDELLAAAGVSAPRRGRLRRLARLLARPDLLVPALRYRARRRRLAPLAAHLESVVFLAARPAAGRRP